MRGAGPLAIGLMAAAGMLLAPQGAASGQEGADPLRSPAAVAVAFAAQGAPTVRLAHGRRRQPDGAAVTADDPVRVASVSKLVVAVGVMRLVEAGRLDLDADVSRYLGWRLRHPAHPDHAITLAQLLGHRAGLVDGVDYILPLDGDLPNVLGDPAAWDAARAPGGAFAYANINFPVVAAAMEGATGERFDRLMQAQLFAPLGIDACFNWTTCSDAAIARAVTLYRPDGTVARDDLGGQRPDCPVVPARDGGCDLARYVLARNGSSFSPQGGLRISMNGLARIGQMLLRRGDGFLTPASVARLMRVEAVAPLSTTVGEGGEGRFFCRYGLGMQRLATRRAGCMDDPAGDGRPRTGHAGEAYSLRSGLWLDMRRRTGIAYYVSGLPETGAPPGARSAFTAAEEAMFAATLGRASVSGRGVNPPAP